MSHPVSDTAESPAKATEGRRQATTAAILLGIGAMIVWGASRMKWLKVTAYEDKKGETIQHIVGAAWSTEVTALSLVLGAAFIAGFALRRLGRRVVGLFAAVAAIMASLAPLSILTKAPDPQRAKDLLTSGSASQKANSGTLLSDWADITNLEVLKMGPALALLGCAIALFGGVLLFMRPGADSAKKSKYETKAAREQKLMDDLEESPDSGRVLWDFLDAGYDPTADKRFNASDD